MNKQFSEYTIVKILYLQVLTGFWKVLLFLFFLLASHVVSYAANTEDINKCIIMP